MARTASRARARARFTKDLHVRKEQKQLHHKKNIVPFSLRIVKHAQRNW
jgi:hypothetical protein